MAGFTGIIDGALQNLEDPYIDKRPYRRVQQFCHTRSRQGSWGNVCVTRCVYEYSREDSRVYVQQDIYIYSSWHYSVLGRYASSCTDPSSILSPGIF